MSRSSRPFVVMRFDATRETNHRLHVLASQLRVPIRDLLLDGIHMVLRYNNAGEGLPQPPLRTPPVQQDQDIEGELEEPTS